MSIIYNKEKTLFMILATISVIFWLAFIVGTVGIGLLWLLVFFIIYLFAHSGFISYIRGTGVEVTEEQFPELYRDFTFCCEKLDIQKQPTLFLLNSDGILNALATKFLGKQYVVLYSSIVEALESRPQAIRFYIGHELGHIKRKHLNWGPILLPATWLPLVGAAYFRACEYSSDLHGATCCEEPKDAAFAIGVLAAGNSLWKKINYDVYSKQSDETGGFWMSFHELVSDYPWLTKRLKHVMLKMQGSEYKVPMRNPIAWFFALFVPRFGIGGGGSFIAIIAIVGILAAVAIPAYQDYIKRAQEASSSLSPHDSGGMYEPDSQDLNMQ